MQIQIHKVLTVRKVGHDGGDAISVRIVELNQFTILHTATDILPTCTCIFLK